MNAPSSKPLTLSQLEHSRREGYRQGATVARHVQLSVDGSPEWLYAQAAEVFARRDEVFARHWFRALSDQLVKGPAR